ncbi:MAG TPA: hypothetical protein PLK68_14660 [Thomasclavelia ramosa]|nr:hypothetical protein [Thomasclavelia ramosa]
MSYNLNYFKNYGSEDYPYWQPSDKDTADIATHSSLVYGDYCNTGAVGKSNVEHIMSLTDLVERTGLYELNDAYNTTGVAIPIKALDDPELVEILEALDNYAILDDTAYYETEQEMKDEVWESYARRDFEKFLIDKGLLSENKDFEDEYIDSIFGELSQKTNYDIAQPDGDSYYYNFDSMGGLYDKAIDILKNIINNAPTHTLS